ncbi:MAG: hypothetical protein ACLFQM_02230 [Fidelibacterota bacterium]
MCENYTPKKMAPGYPAKLDFVGYISCWPIQLVKNVIGIKRNCIDKTIT